MSNSDQFIPHVIVNDARAALKFYREVFGGHEQDVVLAPDGKRIMHAEIVLDGHMLFVSDEFSASEGGTCKTPQTLGGTCVRITVQTADTDATVNRATAAGARVLMAPQDMFWGARYAKIIDPFGHEWGINQQVRELTPGQSEAAAKAFFAERQAKS